jgi:hypothetical protein
MIETMLDRTGFGAKSEHKVTVEHRDLTGPAMLARINELAEKFGIGAGKLPLIEQVVQEEVPRETDVRKAGRMEIEDGQTGTVGESDPAGGAASAGGAGA